MKDNLIFMPEDDYSNDNKTETFETDLIEQEIGETLDEIFPASDPPSWTLGIYSDSKFFTPNRKLKFDI